MFKTVIYSVSVFLFLLILSPDALSASKSWRYTIVNHTNYDIVVSHTNCNYDEWSGKNYPCSNFNNVKISSKTSVSKDQVASNKGKKSGQTRPIFNVYEKGTLRLLFTYTGSTIKASDMALNSSSYVQEVTGDNSSLRNIWVRTGGESFLNIYPLVDSAEWMNNVDGNKTIAQIALPGTHDSGAYSSTVACECQKNSPGQQLDSGVRSFDFRLECYKNELYLVHGSCTFDYKNKVSSELDYFRSYLSRHTSETIIVYAKEENDAKQCSNSNTGELFGAVLAQQEALGLNIIKDYDSGFPTLANARGKMVIIRDYNIDACNYQIKLPRHWGDQTTGDEINLGTGNFKLYVEDAYKQKSANKWKIVSPLLDAASSNSNPQKMYYTYTSCYAPGAPNPAAQASDINEWLAVWLSRNPAKIPAGAIITDYINCTKFGGIGVTQYCSSGGSNILPFMIYSTNY